MSQQARSKKGMFSPDLGSRLLELALKHALYHPREPEAHVGVVSHTYHLTHYQPILRPLKAP
jgi:hypothetical protein